MKVILKQDVRGLGKKDDLVNVSDSYARNFYFQGVWLLRQTKAIST